MRTAPTNPEFSSYTGLRLNADEYLDLGETEIRYELVDGVVVMSPSPTSRHQRIAFLFAHQMEKQAESTKSIHVIPDVDVRIGPNSVRRPDIVVYRRDRLPGIPERLILPPDLIVEVMSPGSKVTDLVDKLDEYGRFGVGEYWVVDPRDLQIRCWRKQGERLLPAAVESTAITSTSIPGLTIDLTEVRSRIR